MNKNRRVNQPINVLTFFWLYTPLLLAQTLLQTKLLARGGFYLQKSAANTPKLLENISQEKHKLAIQQFYHDDVLKVLGLT